jgi:tetratricopeptide (TPR) repeat protein
LSELGASIGSRLDEVEALAWLCLTCIRKGQFSQALNYLDQYGAYAESLGYPHEKHGHQWGRIKYYLAVGALDEAGRWANELFAERKTIPPTFIAAYFTEVVRVKIALGKLEEGRGILDELLANLPLDAPFSYVIIDIGLAYAEINLALGQPENIFEGLDERIQPYREAGFGYLLADELWLRGRAALALGQYETARKSLAKAREAAEAQDERAILWQILVTMSETESENGNVDAAQKFRDQARGVVDDIAAHAGEMRDVFLGQAAVAHLLDNT